MSDERVEDLVEEATFEFTMGEHQRALEILDRAETVDPDNFAIWHARAEIHFDERQLDEALRCAERAHALKPQDVHINTSLSRIWMERGDKSKAEHFGAQARMLGWKEQLQEPEAND